MKTNTQTKTVWMAQTAIFAAIVAVIQLIGGGVHFGAVSISLVLIPIVVGGMMLGPAAGAILGLVFGVITVINGLTSADMFTAILLQSGIKGMIITPLICLGKATAAGFFPALIYQQFKKRSKNGSSLAGAVIASAAAPVINTGLFILGALTLSDVLAANFVAEGTTVIYFLIIGCAGINFIVEFIVNLVLSPAVFGLVKAASKGRLN